MAGVVLSLNIVGASGPTTQPVKVELQDDPPVMVKPKAGAISGQISPAEKIQTIRAVSRVTGKTFLPEKFDEKTGQFKFPKMPGDTAYDICIVTTDGREFEGIDPEFTGAKLRKLAELRRKELALPTTKINAKFSLDDVRAIKEFVAGWQDFLDTRRIIYIRGQGNRATVLIELMRTREFYQSRKPGEDAGQIVWRSELWYMQKQGGGWEKLPNVEKLLRRERTQPREFHKISIEYYPQLTARLSAAGQCKPIHFKIPKKPDPTRGRPANTKINLKTKPHILGVGK